MQGQGAAFMVGREVDCMLDQVEDSMRGPVVDFTLVREAGCMRGQAVGCTQALVEGYMRVLEEGSTPVLPAMMRMPTMARGDLALLERSLMTGSKSTAPTAASLT